MPKKIYVGVDNIARRVRKAYLGIDSARNLLSNGSLYLSTSGWTLSPGYSVVYSGVGYLTIKATTTASSGTFPCEQGFDTISGNTADKKQNIYACAKVRGRSTNVSYPRVYLRRFADGALEEEFTNLSAVDGLSGTDLNDGEWHTVSVKVTTYNESLGRYFDYDRIAFGISSTTAGDVMDIKEIYMCNLTTTYGRGNEPSKDWCDANLTNYAEEIQTGTELSVARRIKKAYQGIDGVARLVYCDETFAKEIDHIEFRLFDKHITVFSGAFPDWTNTQVGTGRAVAEQHGSIVVGDDSISVACSTDDHSIRVYVIVAAILKDGQVINVRVATERAEKPFVFNVTTSFDNRYATSSAALFQTNLLDDSASNTTKTMDVNSTDESNTLNLASINVHGPSYVGTLKFVINHCTVETEEGVLNIPVSFVEMP